MSAPWQSEPGFGKGKRAWVLRLINPTCANVFGSQPRNERAALQLACAFRAGVPNPGPQEPPVLHFFRWFSAPTHLIPMNGHKQASAELDNDPFI